MDRQDKVIDNIVLDDEPHRSNGTQYATEEMLRIFLSTNSVYDITRLKFLGCLIAVVSMQERKS